MDTEKTTVLESAGARTKGGSKKDHAPTLYFIAICKMAKGASLLLLAAGIYWMAGRDLQDDFDKYAPQPLGDVVELDIQSPCENGGEPPVNCGQK